MSLYYIYLISSLSTKLVFNHLPILIIKTEITENPNTYITPRSIHFDKLEMIYGGKNVFTLAEMLLIAIQCSHFCIVLYVIT